MDKQQLKVLEFHIAFDQPIRGIPTAPSQKEGQGRVALIQEELDELDEALQFDDIIEIADALADLLYVVYGTAIVAGIDLEPIFNEVHRSNMTKTGGYTNEAGKYVKPSTYSPTDLEPLLQEQGADI